MDKMETATHRPFAPASSSISRTLLPCLSSALSIMDFTATATKAHPRVRRLKQQRPRCRSASLLLPHPAQKLRLRPRGGMGCRDLGGTELDPHILCRAAPSNRLAFKY